MSRTYRIKGNYRVASMHKRNTYGFLNSSAYDTFYIDDVFIRIESSDPYKAWKIKRTLHTDGRAYTQPLKTPSRYKKRYVKIDRVYATKALRIFVKHDFHDVILDDKNAYPPGYW